jgi:ribose 5-phosphate isomerase A
MTDIKALLGTKLAERLRDGQRIGVGTGSTVLAALSTFAQQIQQKGLKLEFLPTSYQSAVACMNFGLTVLDPLSFRFNLDWAFDGADEVDPQLRVIKGKGAAMLREKLVATRSKEFVIIVDESKLVSQLGEKMTIPIEVIPQALHQVTCQVLALGATEVTLRDGLPGKHGPVITEYGNLVLDARFTSIPSSLECDLKSITGVVETGLFLTHVSEVLVSSPSGVRALVRI